MRTLVVPAIVVSLSGQSLTGQKPDEFTLQAGRLSEAQDWLGLEAHCRRRTEEKTKDAEGWAGLGFALLIQGKQGAREACLAALAIESKHLKARGCLILVEAAANRMAEASKALLELDRIDVRYAASIAANPLLQSRLKPSAPREIPFSKVRILHQPPAPPYPSLARERHVQGLVVTRIVVGPDGIPQSATATAGPDELRKCAADYALQWRFAPDLSTSLPAAVQFDLQMPFRMGPRPPVSEWQEVPFGEPFIGSLDREATLLARARDWASMEALLLKQNPNPSKRSAEVESSLGVALALQGKVAEALLHFERAVEQSPKFVEGLFNLACGAALAGNPARAREAFTRLLARAPILAPRLADHPAVFAALTSSALPVEAWDFEGPSTIKLPNALSYPPLAGLAGIQGEVISEVVVDPAGVPTIANAVAGPHQLRAQAEHFLMRSRFTPQEPRASSGTTRRKVVISYRLEGRERWVGLGPDVQTANARLQCMPEVR